MGAMNALQIEAKETVICAIADTYPALARLVAAVLENPELPNDRDYRATLVLEDWYR